MSAFIKIGDQYYKNLKFICDGALYKDDIFATNYGLNDKYYDIAIDIDNTEIQAMLTNVKPKKGSAIYVAPMCPIPSADIRKNYTIKRGVDTGDYNIICNGGLSTRHQGYHTVVPSLNVVVMNTKWDAKGTYNEFMRMLQNVPGYENVQLTDFTAIKKGVIGIKNLDTIPEVFVKLYDGTLKKPAVSYKNLDMDFGLEMNDDIVELVYRTGLADANTYSNIEKHVLELEALNQYNWRDYPRTMFFLKNSMINRYGSSFKFVAHRTSSQPKSVKQILKENFPEKAASQKDHDLALRFMQKICDIKDAKFVKYERVSSKMHEQNVPVWLFLKAFDATVKLTPAKYEADDGTV